jgi:hypothetical protein
MLWIGRENWKGASSVSKEAGGRGSSVGDSSEREIAVRSWWYNDVGSQRGGASPNIMSHDQHRMR